MRKIRFVDYLKQYLEYNHITNKDFANRIGITPKHLIAILSGEKELSASIIDSISMVTNIPSDYIYRLESNYKLEELVHNYLKQEHLTETEYLKKFHYKFLIEKSWIPFIDTEDKLEMIKDILKYLRVKSPDKVYEIDHNVYFKSKNDKPELLLLWLEKCYREMLKQDIKPYKKDNIEILVNYICEAAKKNIFDESALIQTFNDNGIALVIQEDIPGSKIRGAFKVHKNVPAIYLTYKHKRIADIYFALLHELAHCKRDFNQAKSINFISFEENMEKDAKADEQAYHWMIDKAYYETILSDTNYHIEKETIYPKCFVAYLFAKDHKLDYASSAYQKYNTLISKDI